MARVTLDLDRLVADGKLSVEEARRLSALADEAPEDAAPPGSDAKKRRFIPNMLMIFGALAVSLGVVFLEPKPVVGLILGVAALGGAWFLRQRTGEEWKLLAQALVIGGTLGVSLWLTLQFERQPIVWLVLAVFLAAVALVFRSGVVAVFAPLALGSWLGSGAGYFGATYSIAVTQPAITVAVYAVLCSALFWARFRAGAYEMPVTAMARAAFFMGNFGFWVGSLWGDELNTSGLADLDAGHRPLLQIPEIVFSIGWALALLAAVAIGVRTHRRFVSNTAVVFLGVHFYTQLFESLGAEPLALILGGALLVAMGFGLVRFDAWQKARAAG